MAIARVLGAWFLLAAAVSLVEDGIRITRGRKPSITSDALKSTGLEFGALFVAVAIGAASPILIFPFPAGFAAWACVLTYQGTSQVWRSSP